MGKCFDFVLKHLLLFGFCCSYFCSNVLPPLKVCKIHRWSCNQECLVIYFFFLIGKLLKNVLIFCLNAFAAYNFNEFIDECITFKTNPLQKLEPSLKGGFISKSFGKSHLSPKALFIVQMIILSFKYFIYQSECFIHSSWIASLDF